MKITIEWDGGFNEMTWNRVIENLNYDLRRLDYDSMLTVGCPSTECFHDSESHEITELKTNNDGYKCEILYKTTNK